MSSTKAIATLCPGSQSWVPEVLYADSCEDADRWDELVSASPYRDVYYRPAYALAYQAAGHGEAMAVVVRTRQNAYLFPLLRRPLPHNVQSLIPGGSDAATPYGYGGMLPLEGPLNAEDLNECLDRLRNWCKQEGIVSCYLRLHPLFEQQRSFRQLQRADLCRLIHGATFAVDLSGWDTQHNRISTLHRSRRLQLTRGRRVLRASWEMEDLSSFRSVYEGCMERSRAEAWYMFPREYYDVLTRRLSMHSKILTILHGDEVVGVSLVLFEGRFLHGHLNGITEKGRALNASTMIYNEVAAWARSKGCTLFHIGGGRQEGDSLYQYKKSYGGQPIEYESVGLIADQELYSKLTALRLSRAEESPLKPNHFPLYRA